MSCDKGHPRPIPKVRPLGLYVLYYPEGIFICDRPHLTPSDKKLGSWGSFQGVVQRVFREDSGRAVCVFHVVSLFSLSSLCHSERSEESGNWGDSISALCSRKILRLRCATLRMTKGGFREDSGRAVCVWRVVSVLSLCFLPVLSLLSLCPQDDALTLGWYWGALLPLLKH